MGLEDGKVYKIHDPSTTATTQPTSMQPASCVGEEPMDILRCAPMSLLQLYIPAEAAQATVAELGSLGLVQFRDVKEWKMACFLISCVVEWRFTTPSEDIYAWSR